MGLWIPVRAQVFDWTTLAGSTAGPGFADGQGADARFNSPSAIAADAGGNVYVTDTLNHTIRKVSPNGSCVTFAGKAVQAGASDGTLETARFRFPRGIAVMADGDILVADSGNHSLRRISPAGDVTTIAGVPEVSGSTDGPVASARFNGPRGIVIATDGTIFLSDSGNHTIRRISPLGEVVTFAGSPGAQGVADGPGTAARFRSPRGLLLASDGFLIVADTGNHTLRRISPAGEVTTLAGLAGSAGAVDGAGAAARFRAPAMISGDGRGNIVVADGSNHTLRLVGTDGGVTTFAGSAGVSGMVDGLAGEARFFTPQGLAFDSVSGLIVVADSGNHALRRVSPAGEVGTIAGGPRLSGYQENPGTAARFRSPSAVTVLPDGSTAVADTGNHLIREVGNYGLTRILAGQPGISGTADGASALATFRSPRAIAADSHGNVIIGDSGNKLIRKLSTGSGVTTLTSADEVLPMTERFMELAGVAVNSSGVIYCTDFNQLRFLMPGVTGSPAVLAGAFRGVVFIPPDTYNLYWRQTFANENGDGSGTDAVMYRARGPSCDAAGNIYFADGTLHTIRRCTPAGDVTTIAGKINVSGSNDGTGGAARFFTPSGVAVALDGSLYVSDEGNHVIRRISPGGVVTTIGGISGYSGNGSGAGSAALFGAPGGIAVDAATGAIVVADTANHRIARGVSAAGAQIVVEDAGGLHLKSGDAAQEFGMVDPSRSAPEKSLRIHNVGNEALDIRSITFETGDSDSFEMTVPGVPLFLPPNTSRTIALRFTPDAPGRHSASLVIRSNDPADAEFVIAVNGISNTAPVFSGYAINAIAGRPVTLSIRKLLARASDVDGDLVTLTAVDAVSLLGAALSRLDETLTYTPGPTLVGHDFFMLTLSDALGAQVKGRVDVTIASTANTGVASPTNPPTVIRGDDGSTVVRFHGIPGRPYLIQRSVNLGSWATVATVTAASNGAINWSDPEPPSGSGFYRLGIP